jgi:hypothetical protein
VVEAVEHHRDGSCEAALYVVRYGQRMILVDRYQSIVDTLVQLFVFCPFVVIASLRRRFDRDMRNQEKGE